MTGSLAPRDERGLWQQRLCRDRLFVRSGRREGERGQRDEYQNECRCPEHTRARVLS
jgi:hypothetical protein